MGRWTNETEEERFWSKVLIGRKCWLWTAGVDKDGYGKFQITVPHGQRPPTQVHVRAHRYAYALFAPLPLAMGLMHACDTPGCVRPSHLSPGTQTENRADCTRKGRNATGLRNGRHTHPESWARS